VTEQHWDFWKNRFADISKMDGVSDESQKAAGEAYLSMVAVEEKCVTNNTKLSKAFIS
jgi:hypothetical protein